MSRKQEAAILLGAGIVGLVMLKKFTDRQAAIIGLSPVVVGLLIWGATNYLEAR